METTKTEDPQEQQSQFDGEPGGDYDPELYLAGTIAPLIDGIEAVTEAHVEQYREQGFIAIANAFSPRQVEAALAGMTHLIHGNVPEFKGLSYEKGAAGKLESASADERLDLVRKLMNFVQYEDRLNAMAEWQPLKDLLHTIMGEEAVLFQNQALIKPPRCGREKPWHQDHAYFSLPLEKRIVGVWIALDPVSIENGCMHVLPYSHRKPIVHFRRRDWQICDTDILGQQAVAVELQPGGLLIFDSLLAHGTPANQSERRRRALQFHYSPKSATTKWSAAERMAIFGSEGKDVQC